MALGPEAKVKKECRAYLKSIGAYVFSPVQMGYGPPGLDDYVCWLGHFIGVEYKRPEGGKLTERQAATIHNVQAAGGFAWVICSVSELRNNIVAITPEHQLKRLSA